MPTFTHAGRTHHYLDEGEGPPLVLLHAFPLHAELFRPQLQALRSELRIIAPDLRGFGRSGAVASGEAITMQDYADDVLALMEHLGLEEVALGGVSMGGYIALALLRTDPSRVRALVLSDTQMSADDEAGKQRREDTARALEARGMGLLEVSMPPKLLAQPAPQELVKQVRGWIRETSPLAAAAATRGMAERPDSRDILARYAGPLLVVVGEQDEITPPQKAQEMADLVKGSELRRIRGAGHLPNLEQPEAFNEALRSFFAPLRG